MSNLSRRAFGKVALASPLVVGLAAQSSVAQTGPAAAASTYAVPIGAYRMTALLDGIAPLERSFFFGAEPSEIDATLAASGLSGDTLPAPINAFLLQSADRTILIDAGTGPIDALGPGLGQAVAGLAQLGVAPETVDTILLTHAHPDHLGGLITAEGAALFPEAEVIVTEAEAQFWRDDAMLAAAPEGMAGLFQLTRNVLDAYGAQVRFVADGAEVAPGVVWRVLAGHTPGHAVLRIDGGDRQLMMLADTLHSADLHLAMPQVQFGFDVDPPMAAQSRMAIFDEVSADQTLIAGSHIHFPGIGRILRDGEGYRFAPASWL